MYKQGHVGASLLVYAPLGVAVAWMGAPSLGVAGVVASVALAMLPDYDHRVPLVEHRGITHTVAFALLVGSLLGAAGMVVGGSVGPAVATAVGAFAFAVGAVAVLSHVAADALTPAGVAPLYPLSSRRYTAHVVSADNSLANYALLVLGAVVTGGWLYALVGVGLLGAR